MGHTWLHKHNPEINWITGKVKMSRCDGRCCSGCRDDIRKEQKTQKKVAGKLATCSEGDLPTLLRDDEDDKDEAEQLDSDADLNLVDGDRLFATGLRAPPEEIRATLLYTEFSLITYDRPHICNSARISAFRKRSVEDKQDLTTLIVYRYYDLAAS